MKICIPLRPTFITERTQALVFRLIAKINIYSSFRYCPQRSNYLFLLGESSPRSCNIENYHNLWWFYAKKKYHPTNKQVKPSKRVIQDKLCMSCMDLLKSSSTRPRRIELEEKLANTHLYIQRICKSKDHPSPPLIITHYP